MATQYSEKKTIQDDLSVVVQESKSESVEDNLLTSEKVKRKKDGLFLFMSAFTVNFSMFTIGASVVWTSPVLSRLQSKDTSSNPLGTTTTPLQISLITGLLPFGTIVGLLVVSKLVNTYGPKRVLIFLGGVEFVCLVVLAFATNINFYYLSRFLAGVCCGAIVSVVTVYISEITEKHNRGRYGSMIGIFVPLGNLYSYIIGPMFSIKVFTLLCTAPLLINILLFILMVPESPVYLVTKKNVKAATQVLKRLRNKINVDEDIYEIKLMIENDQKSEKLGFKTIFENKAIRGAFKIAFGLNILQGFSGIVVIMAFLGPIFDSVGTGLSGNATAILVGLVKVTSVTFTSAVVEKLGRRPLLLTSTLFSSITLLLLGTYFHLKATDCSYIDKLYWLPITCVLVFIISYGLGIGCIIFVIMGEVFPSNIKSVAISLSLLLVSTVSLLISFAFPLFVAKFGMPSCFWIFGGSCALGIIFVYFVIPETKGKTFLEIQEMLAG